jgi:NADH:ubiquinone oxidoreductase subunit F (NADH-binding)
MTTLDEHLERYGRASVTPAFLEELEASGLQGRGGAGFPSAVKMRAVAEQGGRPVVVVNAAEGESASGKDKVLLRYVPHLVLDGAVVAAAAIGARKVFLAVGETARTERAAVEEALGERARRRLDGPVQVVVAPIPGGFVSGEETAVINAINGGPPKPTTTPPAPFERGVGRAPTLVQNAETLANVALIARYGAEWFRSQGTSEQPGTVLVTLSGAVAQPGVYEIALGTAIQDLLSQAGGTTAELRALLVGGYFGTWIDADRALPLRLLDADLRAEGASLGARAVVALPDSSCGVCESARAIRYLADESAGQCGPCVFGLGAIAGAFEQIAARERIDPRLDLARWIGEIPGRGACRHPDGAVRFAASALDVFGVEVERHVRHGKCDGDGRPVLPLPTVARQRQRRAA